MKKPRQRIPRPPPPPDGPAQRADPDEAAERALFLRGLATLDRVPDKDRAPLEGTPPRQISRRRAARRRRVLPDATLDLHGQKADEARHALGYFVRQARRRGDRVVLVITGKGLRSEGGVAVLKQEVERWLGSAGGRQVETWSEAPRHLGGRGAYLFHLRR